MIFKLFNNKKAVTDDAVDIIISLILVFLFLVFTLTWSAFNKSQMEEKSELYLNTFKVNYLVHHYLQKEIDYNDEKITNLDLLNLCFFEQDKEIKTKDFENSLTLFLKEYVPIDFVSLSRDLDVLFIKIVGKDFKFLSHNSPNFYFQNKNYYIPRSIRLFNTWESLN